MLKKAILLSILVAAAMCLGCHKQVITDQYQAQANLDLDVPGVLVDPKAAKDQMVVWGGVVLRNVKRPRGTLVEIMQTPLDSDQRPEDSQGLGRFIVAMSGYLDPLAYGKGRKVTVAGRVLGVKNLPHGKTKLTYVLLRGKEIYSWPPHLSNAQRGLPPVEFGFGVGVEPVMPGDPCWWDGPWMWW